MYTLKKISSIKKALELYKIAFNKQTAISNEYFEAVYYVEDEERIKCICSLYINPYHILDGFAYATIGHFEAEDQINAVSFLFNKLTAIIKSKSLSGFIGPMNGSTWEGYRFNLEVEKSQFFLEPLQESYYPHLFIKSGFTVLKNYYSTIDENLSKSIIELNDRQKSYFENGLVIRGINTENIKSELSRIWKLSNENFKDNFLFSPINESSFINLYDRIIPLLDSKLIQIAENKDGELEGFLFAIQDQYQENQIILKTIVRRKNSNFKGLSGLMYNELLKNLKDISNTKIVHALISEDNVSLNISNKYDSKIIRKYSLYIKKV